MQQSIFDSIKRWIVKHFRGGVVLYDNKSTKDSETVVMPTPSKVVIPMVQHLGVPCEPIVSVGDYVCAGQVIAKSDSNFSTPIHSSVSGIVKSIEGMLLPGGTKTKAIKIESDGNQTLYDKITPPKLSRYEDFISAIKESGLVGLGGAGFPTHVKLSSVEKHTIDTLVINCAECEPYITSDYREMIENTDDIIHGIISAMKWLKIPSAVIAIEQNKPRAINVLKKKLSKLGDNFKISVSVLPTRYPQGSEKVLLRTALDRIIPAGKLPADIGVIILNVSTIGFIGRYIRDGIPLITRRVTVAGAAVRNPANVKVPIGTTARDLFDFAGGLLEEPRKILMGGPMMGRALMNDTLPVLKQNNAFLAITQDDVGDEREPQPCIRCGKCVSTCPMKLTPPAIYNAYKLGDIELLKRLGAEDCMECGCCSFVCPAERYLTQAMRISRQLVRKRAWNESEKKN